MDQQRWSSLCRRLGCPSLDERLAVLEKAYSERHRHYHTAQHVRECLDLLDENAVSADHPLEVEFAIWLHDVIYVPRRNDNEERSAALAVEWLRTCVADEAVVDRVRRLILATRHVDPPKTEDEALLLDIDLAILGAEPLRYQQYEQQVRREYRWVPSFIFRKRRAEVLSSFLDRLAVYQTSWFRERRESPARANMSKALGELRGSGAV